FISFSFQAGRAGVGAIKLRYFYQSFFGQMGYLLPFFFFPAIYYAFKSIFKIKLQPGCALLPDSRTLTDAPGQGEIDFRKFIISLGALPVILFLFVSFFKRVLPHWPVIGYIVLALPAGKFYSSLLRRRPGLFKIYAALHCGLVFLAVGVVLIQIHTGIIFNRRVEHGKRAEKEDIRDITVDIIGWDKMADHIRREGLPGSFIFTDKWYLGGQIGFALRGRYPLMVLSSRKDARGFVMWQNQDKYLGKDGVFITTSKFFKDPVKLYGDYFSRIELADTIEVERASKRVKIIYLYRCSGFKKTFPVK
ncbi:MAG: hypothetical protein U9R36_03705, partial [Elusimicrobiota bacterium]|nr:hypothetical protein [Elusimicrobiota bacterium]